MVKKLLSILLALVLVFSLSGCAEILGGAIELLEVLATMETQPPQTQPQETYAQLETALPTEPEQTKAPTTRPTEAPTTQATEAPTTQPTQAPTTRPTETPTTQPTEPQLDRNGTYTSKEDVALYIHLYGELPKNFMTKNEARDLGWSGGGLERYAPGMCIGGDRFGNYEGVLPKKKGRTYTECDIDTLGAKSRGAKRIVFSNDGLIYYTDDHYETFELLYGEE